MANKLLLRILVAARPGIQAGKLKRQDIVSEYFKQTGGRTWKMYTLKPSPDQEKDSHKISAQ